MILCIIQARMGSSRLPGKVLKPILGRPMLAHMLERLQKSQKIDQIAIATSTNPADNELADFCQKQTIPCYRGSEENVLERFADCAALFPGANHIIRLTGDCPLIDPELIDEFIKSYLKAVPNVDSYHLGSPHYPRGLDAEIFPAEVLRITAEEATSDYEKEHVTPFIYQHPERFKCGSYISGKNHNDQRWCVDEEADFELVEAIFTKLYPTNSEFGWQDVLQLLRENPKLKSINAHVAQKNT